MVYKNTAGGLVLEDTAGVPSPTVIIFCSRSRYRKVLLEELVLENTTGYMEWLQAARSHGLKNFLTVQVQEMTTGGAGIAKHRSRAVQENTAGGLIQEKHCRVAGIGKHCRRRFFPRSLGVGNIKQIQKGASGPSIFQGSYISTKSWRGPNSQNS